MIPAAGMATALAASFAERFPVKVNGIPAGLHWERRPELVLAPRAPRAGTFGSRRSDGTLWLLWAREAALGSTVTLRTVPAGGRSGTVPYVLGATPEEALGYLYERGYLAALGRTVARQHLGWVLRVLGEQP